MTTSPGDRTDRRSEPSAAEAARTALAVSSSAALLLHRCPGGGPASWTVELEGGGDGRPVLVVDPGSPVVAALRACPVGALTLPPPGPADWTSLRVTARFAPVRTAEADGRRRYRSTLLAVCLLGSGRRPVELAAFEAAGPDLLRHSAARIVEHLTAAHGEDLVACLRAQGHGTTTVVARAVDRYGLTLACLDADGVRTVRLAFPGGPLTDAADLEAGWALPLRCACDERPA